MEIYETVLSCINTACEELISMGISPQEIKAIGWGLLHIHYTFPSLPRITNQRETTIVWDKLTGRPLHNGIVWLDNRTADIAADMIQRTPTKDKDYYRPITGLPIHPYFSALKLRWLLNNVAGVKGAAAGGNLMFGTVDSWLLWKLAGVYATDVTNASRTLLFDLNKREWSREMCDFFEIPLSVLPTVRSSAEVYGCIGAEVCAGLRGVPIAGCLGDQQAALVGHNCLRAGEAKNTYGTGTFMLCNVGTEPIISSHGLLTTAVGGEWWL